MSGSGISCRHAFTAALLEEALNEPRLYAVTTDARGSVTLGDFAKALPGQFVEIGIAEQNSVGVGSGLARSGKRVFVCGPACFYSARSAEQVKNDVAYAGADVKIVGVSGGVSYGALGGTHHSLHDIALYRAIPNLSVIIPADVTQTEAATRYLASHAGPAYMRLGRAPVPDVYRSSDSSFHFGRANRLSDGQDCAIIACGETLFHALAAEKLLRTKGVRCTVLDIPTIKPLDREAIVQAARESGRVVTVEEHSVFGGLGSAVAEVLGEEYPVPVRIIGFPDEFVPAGESPQLYDYYGLTGPKLADTIFAFVQTKSHNADSIRRTAMKNSFVLAVDQSTSATKAFLFDARAVPVHRVNIEHAQHYPQPGWVEHDAVEILDNSIKALVRVVREADIDARDICALAITNQRETIVAWDEESGAPVHHALVWQDERGSAYCDALKSEGAAVSIQEKTGLVVDTYFSASKLRWIVQNSDAARDALRRGRLLCGTIDAWIIWNLTGRRSFATDYSNACRTLLFDIRRLQWDSDLIDLFGLSGIRLPSALPSNADYGVAEIAGLSTKLPVCGVMGDSHAALFGHAAFVPGAAKTTYGTGSSIMMNVGTSALRPPQGIVSSIGWGEDDEVTYVYEGNINHTGDTIRWARDNLGCFRDYAEAEQLAESIADNGGVYLVPAFSGLGSPHWVHGVRASITGLSRSAGRAEIARAALESIAYQVRDVISAMTDRGTVPFTDLRVDGGATANRFLMQFQADLLGAPLQVAAIEEVSARGVALMAGKKQGLWKNRAEIESIATPARTYNPKMTEPARDANIRGWNHAVAQTLLTEQTKEA